jgi:tetratricopeptide (TPR) repeat protein
MGGLSPSGRKGLVSARAVLLGLGVSAALFAMAHSPARAVEAGKAQCDAGDNADAAIAVCSSIIQKETDHHKQALAYYNRAGWYVKKNDFDAATSDLTLALRLEPGFAAALTKRGLLYEQHYNALRDARNDYEAVLNLPEKDSLSAWARNLARERLALMATMDPNSNAVPKKSLGQYLEECSGKSSAPINLPGAKGQIQLNQCYRGRQHFSCTVSALLAEASSIKQDYSEIIAADYPNLKTLDSICQLAPDRLSEHARAIQAFKERWAAVRKEYAARADCTNSVEDSLHNLSLADMSYGADIVKSMIESVRSDMDRISAAQKDVLNMVDKMDAAGKAIEDIMAIQNGVCR